MGIYEKQINKRYREMLREERSNNRRKEVHRSIAYIVLLILLVIAAFMLGVHAGQDLIFLYSVRV